jgi:purine-nucleoside phosphorylase
MDHLARELDQAVAAWDARGWPRPDVLLVSGSGLAVDLGAPLVPPAPLAELLPFAVHELEGHPHRYELLQPVAGRTVLYLRGRLHAYQGYDAAQVVFPVRLARLLGAAVLVMTNAAGGVRLDLAAGDLLLIEDQINLSGLNPLRGEPPAAWGPRFPSLEQAYDARLRALVAQLAAQQGLRLATGVYLGLPGPSYETPAEVRMLRALGADVVGMSTVLEVIAARHMGMRCVALSLVSNLGAGCSPTPLDHGEVMAAGLAAARELGALLGAVVRHPDLLR